MLVFRQFTLSWTLIFGAWLTITTFLIPDVASKARVDYRVLPKVKSSDISKSKHESNLEHRIVVKDNSNDLAENDDEFSFEQDEDLIRVVPNVNPGVGGPPPPRPLQPQTLDVGVELGFRPQKVKIDFGPGQQQSQQWHPQQVQKRPQQWQQSAVVSNSHYLAQGGNDNVDANQGFGMMDEKRMKSIFDDVAEAILQAADALYYSMHPEEAQASGFIWGGGGQGQGGRPHAGALVENGNQASRLKWDWKSSWTLIASVAVVIIMQYL